MLQWTKKIFSNKKTVTYLGVFLVTVFCLVIFSFPGITHAQTSTNGGSNTLDVGLAPIEKSNVLPTGDLRVLVIKIINIALGFLGIVQRGGRTSLD